LAVTPATERATAAELADASSATHLIERPAPVFDDDDRWGGHALPHDHPAWPRDAVSLSQRARAYLAKVVPPAIATVAQWSRRTRAVALLLPAAGFARTLRVDGNGFYRIGW